MKVLEAKDSLVLQTAEQAAVENEPITNLEKRIMYFTEADECPEDPIALNDAFEAEYDTDKYEEKVSREFFADRCTAIIRSGLFASGRGAPLAPV